MLQDARSRAPVLDREEHFGAEPPLQWQKARQEAPAIETLTGIFERVLGHGPIGPDDDFFDLGGSSMLAISLILEIEQLTGRELPVSAIYDAPTVNAMGAVLASDSAPTSSPVILLRSGPASPCLFLIHGSGGAVMELRELATRIDGEFAIHGLQATGLDGSEPEDSIEAMADAYVERVMKVQPSGPYLLAGYCFGGLIAFEMARRLLRRGEDVRFVGLIDSYPDDGVLTRRLRRHLARLARTSPRDIGREIDRLWRSLLFRLRVKAGRAVTEPEMLPLPKALLRIRTMNKVAFQRYRPAPCDCDVDFFQAAWYMGRRPANPVPIWRRHVRRLTVTNIPADHDAMIRSNVGLLASLVARQIATALAPR